MVNRSKGRPKYQGRYTQTVLDLAQPKSDWTPPVMSDLPDPRLMTLVGVDCETKDEGLHEKKGPGWATGKGFVCGWSFWTEEQGAYYLPVRHEGGDNLPLEGVKKYVADVMKNGATKVFHNAVYDIGWMKREGIDEFQGEIRDSMYAAALLDENRRRYGLDSIAQDWLGEGKDETLLEEAVDAWGWKARETKDILWKLPAKFVGPYAEQDARATALCHLSAMEELTAQDLLNLYALECELILCFVEMRWNGVRVDLDRAEELKKLFDNRTQTYMKEINTQYGVCGSPWNEKEVGNLLKSEGVPMTYTKTGQFSLQASWLESLSHPLAKLILNARRYYTAGKTFVDSMVLGNEVNGRIHCEFHPLKSDDGGTVSGRLSSSNPNMQQVPARDPELAPLVRSMYLPEEGCVWGIHDYSQQEPRLTVHYAELTGLKGGREAGDYYRNDPDADYHTIVAKMAGIDRKPAKILNLGLAYGMGGVELCNSLGLPTEFQEKMDKKGNSYKLELPGAEGLELFEKYHERVPYVRGLTKATGTRAADRGWVRTILGRRCRFDLWEPSDWRTGCFPLPLERAESARRDPESPWHGAVLRRAFTHKALNRLIQGSAADQTKKAMLDLWKEGIVPMIQAHDELDNSIPDEATARRVNEIMEHTIELLVPSKIDCELGPNWGNCVDIEEFYA